MNAPTTTNETCAQTAKRVRAALKAQYPDTKFSVRSHTYAGGASIHARYVDGPAERDVWTFLQKFAGADFDGMTDMKEYRGDVLLANENGTYELINSGADFVFADRQISQAWREDIAREIERVTGLPCDLTQYGDSDSAGAEIKRNGAGWAARYDAYVIDGRIVVAGDHPQAYGRDLFHEASRACRGRRRRAGELENMDSTTTLRYDNAPREITADEARAIAHAEHQLSSRNGQHYWMSRGSDGGMHLRETFTRSQAAITQINARRNDLRERIMAGRCQHTIFYDRARDTFYCG